MAVESEAIGLRSSRELGDDAKDFLKLILCWSFIYCSHTKVIIKEAFWKTCFGFILLKKVYNLLYRGKKIPGSEADSRKSQLVASW